MTRYSYDLHLHSCLSPCGDDEATPAAIAGMAKVLGLDLVALTDHNTAKNCPAFFKAAEFYGVTPVAGMELTTAEDIHLLCLFPDLHSALQFDEAVEKRRIPVKNKPQVFGNQLIMNEEDLVIGEEENLLINATTLSLEEGTALCKSFGGAALPAHIDRESNGLIAVLGAFPAEPEFSSYEIHDGQQLAHYEKEFHLEHKLPLISSDAHHLEDISEPEHFLELDAQPGSDADIRKALIQKLRGESSR